MFGIRLDRFDHQVEFIGAVDLARSAVVGAWLHGVGFSEVMQPINAVGGMVEHHEDRARTAFRPQKQGEMVRDASDCLVGDFYGGPTQYSLVCKAYHSLTPMRPFEFCTSRTVDLHDFETTKPFNELLTSSKIAFLHSAATLTIDSLNPDGTLNPEVYRFLSQQNAELAPYEPFWGVDLLADVAVYCDKESVYDPAENGVHVAETKRGAPHMSGVVGADWRRVRS